MNGPSVAKGLCTWDLAWTLSVISGFPGREHSGEAECGRRRRVPGAECSAVDLEGGGGDRKPYTAALEAERASK